MLKSFDQVNSLLGHLSGPRQSEAQSSNSAGCVWCLVTEERLSGEPSPNAPCRCAARWSWLVTSTQFYCPSMRKEWGCFPNPCQVRVVPCGKTMSVSQMKDSEGRRHSASIYIAHRGQKLQGAVVCSLHFHCLGVGGRGSSHEPRETMASNYT